MGKILPLAISPAASRCWPTTMQPTDNKRCDLTMPVSPASIEKVSDGHPFRGRLSAQPYVRQRGPQGCRKNRAV